MKIMMVKTLNNTFKPMYDSDLERIKRIKQGEGFMVDITRPRNIKFHRKFFALINLVFQNQEVYKNIDHLRNDLTVEAGFFDEAPDFLGEVKKRPKSISFAAMDDDEFSDFYDACISTIVKYFNFDRQDIIDNVAEYF